MRILIIHQNFPGQFRHLINALKLRKDVQLLGIARDTAPGLEGVPFIRYPLQRVPIKEQHPYLRTMESAILHGQAVSRVLLRLRQKGFVPDIVLAHPGWGESLYVRDIFPNVKLVHFCEWFYGNHGSDMDFDPEFPVHLDDKARVRSWNALHLLNLENCDVGVTPTHWQWHQHPNAYQSKIVIAHEGIDTERLQPDENAILTFNGKIFRAGEPIVTYVARNLEPYRGFHSFMRALEVIQRKHQSCQTIIVGGDDVSYGRRPSNAKNWREKMLREVKVDPDRTHFVGRVPYDVYRKVLQVSAAHIYLTYPFVLSWSMLEAMASGCLVIGSSTEPVTEVIKNQSNGILVNFFDLGDIAEKTVDALSNPQEYRHLRRQSQSFSNNRFSRQTGIGAYYALFAKLGVEFNVAHPFETTPEINAVQTNIMRISN